MKKISFLIIFLIGNITMLSAINIDYSSLTDTIEPKVSGEKFVKLDRMPRFPGCNDVEGSESEKRACADKKLLEYIYKNIKYPEAAVKDGIEGYAVIRFVVEKDGSISNAKIARNPGGGLGEEALRVIESMNDLPEKWMPGLAEGKPVRGQMNIPVKFRLNLKSTKERKKEKRRKKRKAKKKH